MKNILFTQFIKSFSVSSLLVVSMVSCDNSLPDEYKPPKAFLSIDTVRNFILEDELTLTIPVKSSSAWSVESTAPWCKPKNKFYMGNSKFICDLELNREDKPRNCIIYINMNTAFGYEQDSILLTQNISIAPEIKLEYNIITASSEGETIKITVTHNYGVKIAFDQNSMDASSWLALSTNSIEGNTHFLQESTFEIECQPCKNKDRQATLLLTNTEDKNAIPITLTITQKAYTQALIFFEDDFENQVKGQSFNPERGWSLFYTGSSSPFKVYPGTPDGSITKTLLLFFGKNNTELNTGWLVTPPINVKALTKKELSYQYANGNNNQGCGTLEIVYSTDFDTDAEKAVWKLLYDGTEFSTTMRSNLIDSGAISLLDLGHEERVWFAIRYTEKTKAYRIDNFKIE